MADAGSIRTFAFIREGNGYARAMKPYLSVAQQMLTLLIGSLFVVIDINSKSTEKVETTSSDGTKTAELSGWQFDFVPDEIGYLCMGFAYLGLARLVAGSLQTWIKALGGWQFAMVFVTVIGHRVNEVAVTKFTENGSMTTTMNWSVLGSVAAPLEAAAVVAAGWCLAKLCRSLGLGRGAQLWTRYARVMTVVGAFQLAGILFVLLRYSSGEENSLLGLVPWLGTHFVAFAVLAAVLMIALGLLWLHACLATRSEALGRAMD